MKPDNELLNDKIQQRVFGVRMFFSIVFALLLITTAIVERVMIMSPFVRATLVATIIWGILTGIVHVFGSFKVHPGRLYPIFFFIIFFIMWIALAAKQPDIHMLRNTYVDRLLAHKNEPFQVGGETDAGVDDSGLARSSMWQAMIIAGLKEINPRLLGPEMWKFWWRDLDTKDIENGKYTYSKKVGYTPKLGCYESYDLEKGDIAVISKTKQILVYIGNGRWITTSQKERKVTIVDSVEESSHQSMCKPATIYRWWIFFKK